MTRVAKFGSTATSDPCDGKVCRWHVQWKEVNPSVVDLYCDVWNGELKKWEESSKIEGIPLDVLAWMTACATGGAS